ncbi:MAG: plasmid pRiA4b ORF-3 family protein [Anaerolineae bacterium]
MRSSKKERSSEIYQVKVTLKGSKPPIWRRFQVPSDVSLYDLHQVLQVVMGWEDYHLYQFIIGETYFSDPDLDNGWG